MHDPSIVPGGYSKQDYYIEVTTTDNWVVREFIDVQADPFVCGGMTIVCDSVNPILFSFDGENVHGELRDVEALTMDNRNRQRIYFKSATPGSPGVVRFWAW